MTINLDVAKKEMQRLSAELHGGQYAPNSAEYRHYNQSGISIRTIYNCFPTWIAFSAACGLDMAPRDYYYSAAKARGGSIAAVQRAVRSSEDKRSAAAIAATDGLFQDGRALALPSAGMPCKPWQTKTIFDWRTYRYIIVEAAVLL